MAAGTDGPPPPPNHSFDELYDQFVEIGRKLDRQNELLKLNNTLALISGHGLPRSKYWQWFQFNSAAPGQALTTTLKKGGGSVDLVTQDKLPSNYGWLHSFDFLCDSGLISLTLTYSSGGQQFKEGGKLQDFWAADFNPRVPASAGDPIVVNQAVDDPGAAALTNWSVRTSPSFNVPFNTPFMFTATNTDATADHNILAYDIFFIMIRKEFSRIIEQAEKDGYMWGGEVEEVG